MRDFPPVVTNAVRDFYRKAEDEVLHVETADEIADPVFKAIPLQGRISHYLDSNHVAGGFVPESARLATGRPLFGPASKGYRHFSVIASLLTINDVQNTRAERKEGSPIMIATDTIVERFEVEGAPTVPAHARILHTSRGPLTLHGGKTNVILAAGAIPNTTILLNSIKDKKFQRHAGQRLTAHFRSKVMARFEPTETWFNADGWTKVQAMEQSPPTIPVHPVISAHHVRGRFQHNNAGPFLQWHIQLHGIYVPKRWKHHIQELQGMVPDLWSAPTDEQLEGCGGYLVLSTSHMK